MTNWYWVDYMNLYSEVHNDHLEVYDKEIWEEVNWIIKEGGNPNARYKPAINYMSRWLREVV